MLIKENRWAHPELVFKEQQGFCFWFGLLLLACWSLVLFFFCGVSFFLGFAGLF